MEEPNVTKSESGPRGPPTRKHLVLQDLNSLNQRSLSCFHYTSFNSLLTAVNTQPKKKNRTLGEQPFCWIEKTSLRKIKKEVERKNLPHLRSVYLALTEIASNKETESFEIYIDEISRHSGVSTKTVSKHLKKLKELNLVQFEEQERTQEGKYKPIPIQILSSTVGNFEIKTSDIRILKKKSLNFLISKEGKERIQEEFGEIENYDEEVNKMVDWQKAKGIKCHDYSAQFRNWIRKGREFKKNKKHWYSEAEDDDKLTLLAKACFNPNKEKTYYKDILKDEMKNEGIETDIEIYLKDFKKAHENN